MMARIFLYFSSMVYLMDDCYERIVVMSADIDGKTYKSLMFTCTRFSRILLPHRWRLVDKRSDHAATIVKKHGKDCGLNYEIMVASGAIDIEEASVMHHEAACESRHFSIDDLMKVCPRCCDGRCISYHPDVTIEVIRKYPKYSWCPLAIANREWFTFEVFRDNIDLMWSILVDEGHDGPKTAQYLLDNVGESWNILLSSDRCSLRLAYDIIKSTSATGPFGNVLTMWHMMSVSSHVTTDIVANNPNMLVKDIEVRKLKYYSAIVPLNKGIIDDILARCDDKHEVLRYMSHNASMTIELAEYVGIFLGHGQR